VIEGRRRKGISRLSPLLSTALALLLALWPPLAGVADGVARASTNSPLDWLSLERTFASVVPLRPLLHLFEGSSEINTGSDGRLTILLLGSDSRGSAVGLTDTIMIMSIKGHTISAASIPRDAVHLPNPDGGTFGGRANSILENLARGRTVDDALARFEVVIEQLLQVEIDYYAMVKFDGFDNLVQEIQPVSIDNAQPIRDPKFWDDPNKLSGVYFPAASNYKLWAWQPDANPPLCNGLWRQQPTPIASQYWCRRALPYVRSRKGSGNSDFVRAHRQQDFVAATIRRVIERGSGSALGALVNRAYGQQSARLLYTDIPLTTASALDLYQTLSDASVGFQVVFSPPQYATHVNGSTAYQLDLAAIRQVTRQWFGGGRNLPAETPGPTSSSGPPSNPGPQPTAAPSPSAEATAPTAIASQPTPSTSPPASPPSSAGGGLPGPGDVLLGLVLVLIAVIVILLLLSRSRRKSAR
jgi:anionic cell wall polymer biosynthesis LytR-Cps2A-Psr (LCP) family protein